MCALKDTAKPEPTVHKAGLVSRRWLSRGTFEITLTRPAGFEFQAGQSLCLLHEDLERHYSMVSAPDAEHIFLCIRHIQGGLLTPTLAEAKIGARFNFSGPHGYFMHRPSPRPAIFVATGTGIAPFVSMVSAGAGAMCLLHGVRRPEELYYRDILRKQIKQYIPCLSDTDSESPKIEDVFAGQVTEYIAGSIEPGEYDFYLSGNQTMIRDVTHLVDERFSGSYIFTEIFY